ncbi:MAG: hypothetical protein L0H94_05605 [Nitrospira sp.]|nr:hypothetical protein [Nitrospira sp.]
MTRATVLQEVRQMRVEELCERRQRQDVTMAEVEEILEITERTFRRWSGRDDVEGAEEFQTGGSVELRPARYPWMRRWPW